MWCVCGCACELAYVCVRACVRACVRVCVCACVRACVRVFTSELFSFMLLLTLPMRVDEYRLCQHRAIQRIQGGLSCLKTPLGHVGEGLRPPCVRDKYYGKGQRI